MGCRYNFVIRFHTLRQLSFGKLSNGVGVGIQTMMSMQKDGNGETLKKTVPQRLLTEQRHVPPLFTPSPKLTPQLIWSLSERNNPELTVETEFELFRFVSYKFETEIKTELVFINNKDIQHITT